MTFRFDADLVMIPLNRSVEIDNGSVNGSAKRAQTGLGDASANLGSGQDGASVC